jgi:tetratricopeptide (TPR) repeat protein
MALKQKLDEAKKAKELQRMVGGVFAPQAAAPTAGAEMPPAQAAARPMNPNAAKANQYRQAAQMLNMAGQTEQAMKYEDLALKLDPTSAPSDKAKLLAELGLPMTLENMQLLESAPNEVRLLKATGTPVTMANVMALKRSGAASTVVNMNEGQKGLENVMKVASAFKGEPIYKDFNDMKSAYGQVISSLDAGTPIGDVAGATKVMKLLDPGSVVRESELGIAMAAAGRMDRLQNYFNNLMTGEKLTPKQRLDFKSLSNELYAAAGQAYNQKRSEYEGFGNAYQLPNLNTALGAPANVPSIVKPPPQAGGSGLTWDPAQKKFVNR